MVKETSRLHPPTPLLAPRESMDKCILDGFEIPAKTRVVINAFAIERDPKSWEDSLVYNPERFIDDEDNKNGSVVDIDHVKDQEFKFVPFGGCPGFAFGLATIEIALARLFYHFNWELPPEVLEPHDVDLDEIFGLASRKRSLVRKWVPIESYRVECMSILGLLMENDAPLLSGEGPIYDKKMGFQLRDTELSVCRY
nr:tryptamine 5-hydroxylase-like [Ziziphus jujuba var. spinosa]